MTDSNTTAATRVAFLKEQVAQAQDEIRRLESADAESVRRQVNHATIERFRKQVEDQRTALTKFESAVASSFADLRRECSEGYTTANNVHVLREGAQARVDGAANTVKVNCLAFVRAQRALGDAETRLLALEAQLGSPSSPKQLEAA